MKTILFLFLLLSHISLNAQSFELGESIVGYDNRASFICFTDQDSIVLSGTFDGEIEKWNVSQAQLISSTKISSTPIKHIEFNAYKQTFFTSDGDKSLKEINFSTFEILNEYTFNHTITHIYQNDNYPCFVSLNNGELHQIQNNTSHLVLKSRTPIESVIFQPSNQNIIINDGKSIQSYNINSKRVNTSVLQPSNSWFSKIIPYQKTTDTIISISENGHIHFWDIKKGTLIQQIQAKNDFYNRGINVHSKNLVTGFYNNKSLLFSLDDYDLEFDMHEEIEISNTLVCSKDQRYLITADQSGHHKLLHLIGDYKIPKLAFQKRDLKLESIKLLGSKIEIEIWDHEEIDGDRVSLNLNNQWLCRNYEISAKKKVYYADLEEGDNILLFHAENLGKYPPNTCAMVIKTPEGEVIERIMRSDLDESSGLTIEYHASK